MLKAEWNTREKNPQVSRERARMCEEEDQKCGSELVTQCVWLGSQALGAGYKV